MAYPLKDRLGALLVKSQMITQEQLDEALRAQKEGSGKDRIGDVLVRLGFITKEKLILTLSAELGIAPIRLEKQKAQPEAIASVSRKIAELYCLLPISKMDKSLTVAMADPLNVNALDDLRRITNLEIRPLLATEKEIKEAIEQYYGENTAQAMENVVKQMEADQEAGTFEVMKESTAAEDDNSEALRMIDDEPVVKLTNSILSEGVKRRTSDIFIEPEEKNMRVRFRVDGMLQEGVLTTRAMHTGVVSRIKIMSNLDIAEHRLPQDGRFKARLGGKDVDFRVSVLPSYFGEKVVLRILDKTAALADLDKMGFEPRPLADLKKASEHPHGMILVCGPTGSGKTTTLYGALRLIDKPDVNIVTVEDPVEFQMDGINQVNIRPEVKLTFAAALRSILRQDPDIVMVGEIRDSETADVAVKAALTGHLVLSTLHTTTAAGSVIRLVNMGIEPFLIASSAILIAAQRLVRRICAGCRESYEPTKEVMKEMGITEKHLQDKKPLFYRGKGCDLCHGKTYSGRAVLLEALTVTASIKVMILKRAQEYELKAQARKDGMMTLRENGIAKILSGVTTPEEVARVTIRDLETS